MSETLHPGVFVEEIPVGPKPIEGVPTDAAALVGQTDKGRLRPQRVSGFADYQSKFGGAAGAGRCMALAVAGFFDNGGRELWVVRVGGRGRPADWSRAIAMLDHEDMDHVSLVSAPGVGDPSHPDQLAVQRALVAHCEAGRHRFAVLEGPPGAADPAGLAPRATLGETGYAALYHPWIKVADPETGAPTQAPPGGHVLGVYARTDAERGVFKAPANQVVVGALAVAQEIGDAAQELLNPRGVNVIRKFSGRDIRVWGARTLSQNSEWKYVPVRRLFIFLERSIDRGLGWVVFEPNGEELWARVSDTVRLFLRGQWRAGAFQGRTEQEAFFVRCDASTMTQDDIDNGRLVAVIGVAPLKPAEFVIFRIGQWTAESMR
jgi:phage tail sheath protein FI